MSPAQHRSSAPSPYLPSLTFNQSLVCGAVGRASQVLALFPVDTVKTRVQAARSISSPNSPLKPLFTAIAQGHLYSGVAVSLLGQVPYGMLTFGFYESLRSTLSKSSLNLPKSLQIVIAASLGDAVGSLWLTPSEVIKSKSQTGMYPTPLSTARAIASQGPLAFYQGYFAAIARDVPFRAIQLFLFERCRDWYSRRARSSHPNKTISPVENLLIGALSGTATAVVTTPLDVIRTRMMSQPSGKDAIYKNALDCISKTFTNEGTRAFFRGLGPRVLLVGPASAVFFVTYEATKSFLRSRSARKNMAKVSLSPRRCHRLRQYRS